MDVQMYKTTLNFDPDLYFAAKKIALEKRQSTTELIQNALRREIEEYLAQKKNAIPKAHPGFHYGKSFTNKFDREELYDFI